MRSVLHYSISGLSFFLMVVLVCWLFIRLLTPTRFPFTLAVFPFPITLFSRVHALVPFFLGSWRFVS